MTIDRRRALALFGLGGASAAGEAMAATPRAPFAGRAAFLHGVASGDPLDDRVVLWTRITAEATTAPIAVRWDVATDPAFKTIVRQGQATAVAARDHTVKVDVTGLKPATDYYLSLSVREERQAVRQERERPDPHPASGPDPRRRPGGGLVRPLSERLFQRL
jgi:phosphodiesterase/alkaline phosphatase D-like protein